MPKLKIDGREIEVEQGTKVIEAAARLGIIIPRFCYHKGLGSVGACRMCAVKFTEGPVKGIQMSCMVDACDGMAVSTTDEEAVDFRRHVIEWLMMNHPHDCPVCDEGGHCLLQDMTVAGGHGIRRYLGKKRTYRDQYLGVFVQHEMNRCIHCWRCRRFYQEFAGYRDLGAMQIAYHTYFGRFKDGPLESPFSGNLIDLCPTGVYTDKPSRFTGRRWDFERSPSLCIHCSLGCHIITSAHYRETVRLEARFSDSVNGYFICDRGRYGFYYSNHPQRPRRPRVGTGEVSWENAIQRAGEKLSEITEKNGAQSVACLGSTRSSLENQAMLKRFCKLQGWREPRYFIDPSAVRKVRKAASRLDKKLAVSMREIERADFIIAVGADPVNEAPMLTLAMRQAHRQGATIVVIDPRPIFLPFEFHHFPAAPEKMAPCLNNLIKEAVDRSMAEPLGEAALRFYDTALSKQSSTGLFNGQWAALGKELRQSKNPVIVCGTEITSETTPGLAADNALLLQAAKKRAGLFYLMPGPNAFGAALLTSEDGSLMEAMDAIESGTVKALVVVESDPFRNFPDQQRLKRAVGKLDLLLVMDYLPSEATRLAQIFLPTRTLFEMETSFVNQEGRVQFATAAYHGGIPISQISAGGHPPRLFQSDIPGGEPEPAWVVLAKLAHAMSVPGQGRLSPSRSELWEWIKKEHPVFSSVPHADPPPEGLRIDLVQGKEEPFAWRIPSEKARRGDDELELLVCDWTFGTEELSTYSNLIQQVEKEPCLFMNPKDASRAGVKDGERVTLDLNRGPLAVELRVANNVAPGVIVLPKHRRLDWQRMERESVIVGFERIRKQGT
ncbi:MAG TPA: NADH-quinone oxidoreductase subunit NuoG [Thermodesulfobacteriota bacterium]|nr:NADH-quinone oxidoreductase subunit NuoG [Thermodesulfobacteriota bacterium]